MPDCAIFTEWKGTNVLKAVRHRERTHRKSTARQYFLSHVATNFVLRSATKVVHVVNRYSEVPRGAMVAHEIIDKLLALSAAVTRAAKMIYNPAQNSAK